MPQRPVTHAEFHAFTRKLVIFCIIISLGCAGGLYGVMHESSIRTAQNCELIVAKANDTVKQFDQTVEYIRSPAGQENTGLNKVIRERSFPAIGKQVAFDQQHRVKACQDIDVKYKDTKYPDVVKKVTAPPQGPVKKN